MQPGQIENPTRVLGKPADWDDAAQGPCGTLPIREVVINGLGFAASAWVPSPEEIELINAGHPVIIGLGVEGDRHPVVFMGVGTTQTLGDE